VKRNIISKALAMVAVVISIQTAQAQQRIEVQSSNNMASRIVPARIDADLQVLEGMSHAQYILVFTSPESKEAFQEIARFFPNHLGR